MMSSFAPWILLLLVVVVATVVVTVLLLRGRPSGLQRASGTAPEHASTGGSTVAVMDAARWRRVQDLMLAALNKPVSTREQYLRAECGADIALFDEVVSLVAASERDGVLDELAVSVVQPMLDGSIREGDEIGRYRIGEVLGQGGMGVVYRARDARLDRTVALKFLPAHASTDLDAKERFLLEARAAAALDHPNVCTIHEIGETETGFLYIAMPFYDGETLRDRLSRGALPIDDAIAIAMQVARGLSKAHERGIVHRDIKPANIVMTEDGVAKILDFGVAKLTSSNMTHTGVQPGTVAYMSPEQASGGVVDQRSDIWALGVVLHEMLTGRNPFGAGQDAVMVHAILTRELPAPSSTRADVPAELDRIVQRALARDTAERYAEIRDMASDLEECAARAVMADEARTRSATAVPIMVTLPAEGERRSVTVLVSSIAGSIEALERLTPAEADAAMQSLRDAAQRIMNAHGGVVNEVTGEELVCLFGVPEAHEDDYVRSVRAATELHAAAAELEPVKIQLQSGIDAGFVLARPSDARDRAFRVAGDPVRTATLLSTQAEPGVILVSPRCQRLIAPYYLMRALPPIAGLRGESRFVPHRVLGKSGFESRLEAAGSQGLTRYTGREKEMQALRDALAAMQRGEGAVVGVIGDAGVGKSRLLHEFRNSLDPATVDVLAGRCQSHDNRTPYLPFVSILLRALGLNEDSSDAELAVAVASRIQQDMPALTHLIPLCLQVLGLSSDEWPIPRDLRGMVLRAASGEAVATLLTTVSDRKPLIVMLEDWHWADDASRDALDPLVALAASHRLLIVVTCRPDITLDWGWSRQHTTLRLDPLDDSATATVMQSVLHADRIERELAATIHERTGGNPFFIEELCRALVEQGSLRVEDGAILVQGDPAGLNLPETVQLVIRTRLDRLDASSRNALRTASVIGREFSRRLLEKVSDDAALLDASLARLRDSGLIQPMRLLPDPVYRFRHALTQEVAYSSLPEHLSRALHMRVGEALEAEFEERGESNPTILCNHFAGAEDWPRAVRYARDGAERISLLSVSAAKAQLDRALEWIDRLPDDTDRTRLRIDIMFENERHISALGDRGEQRAMLNELIALLEPGGDSADLVQAYVRVGELNTLTDEFDAADDALGSALQIARRLDNTPAEADVCTSLAFLRWNQGRNEEGRDLLERTIEIRRSGDDSRLLVGDLINIGTIIGRMGDHATAIETVERALEMCRGDDLPSTEINALMRLAFIHRESDNTDKAFELVRQANALARSRGLRWMISVTGTLIADAHLRAGDIDACLAEYATAIEESRRTGIALGVAAAQRGYGLVLYGLGRYAEAVPPLAEASDLLERVEKREDAAHVRQALALALERLEDDAGALDQWQRLRAHRNRSGDDAGELAALDGIIRAQRRTGAEASMVIASIDDAIAITDRLGDTAQQGSLLNTVGIIEFERSNMVAARTRFEDARVAFERDEDVVNVNQMIACIAACDARLGDHEAAITNFKDAISGHRAHRQHRLEAQALGALGDVYVATGDFASAAMCFEESLRIRREIGDRAGEGWMLLSLGRATARGGKAEQSEQYWDEARSIALECSDAELHAALAACTGERAI